MSIRQVQVTTMLTALAVGTLSGLARAESVKLSPIRYVYRTPVSADPDRTRLCDGLDRPHGDVPFGRPRVVDVVFGFERPVILRRVVVASYKRTRAYALDTIDLFVNLGAGDVLAGHTRGYAYNRDPSAPIIDATSRKSHRFEFQGRWSGVHTARIRARTGAYLDLSEVTFFGSPAPNAEPRVALPPDGLEELMRALARHRAGDPNNVAPAPIPFARPWKDRPKVLVLTSKINQGEVVELARRFDAEWQCPFWMKRDPKIRHDDFYGHLTPDLMRMAVLRVLEARSYDAIVLGGIDWDHLGTRLQAEIRKQVNAGTGLVAIAPRGTADAFWQMLPVRARPDAQATVAIKQAAGEPSAPNLPYAQLALMRVRPYVAQGRVLASAGDWPLWVAGKCGSGTVAVLAYDTMTTVAERYAGCRTGGLTPAYIATETAPRGNPARINLWYDLVVRALLGVTRTESGHAFSAVRISPDGEIRAVADDAARAADAFVQNLDGAEVSGPHALRLREGEWQGNVSLHAGENLVWVRALRDGRVQGWHTGVVEVAAEVDLTDASCESNVLTRGRALLARATVTHAIAQTSLRATLTDAFGGVVSNAEIRGAAGEHALTLATDRAQSVWTLLRVWLAQDGRRVSRVARFAVYVHPGRPRDFARPQFVIWSNLATTGMRPHLVPEAVAELRRAGITAALFNAPNSECVAMSAAGLRVCVLGGGIGHCMPKRNVKSKFDLVRQRCLSDPEWLDSWEAQAERAGRLYRRFAPLDYWFGDEQSITRWTTPCDYCFSPHCLAAFREWLRTQYANVGELNREWRTDFGVFRDVTPATLDELPGKEAVGAWGDHRAFMEHVFTTVHEKGRSALLRGDPEGRFATSGTQGVAAYGGWDWTRIPHVFDVFHAYRRQDTDDIRRSFGGATRLPWAAGYGASGGKLKTQVWRAMLSGSKGASVFVATSLLNGDLTPCRGLRDLADLVAPLRGKLGEWLCAAEPVFDPVAVHYSQRSVHAAHALGLADAQRENRHAAIVALKDIGLQPRFITSEQLARGDLLRLRVRLLVLPLSLAMSDTELEGLRTFVERGGWTLALGPAATMNEHLRHVPRPIAADILGAQLTPVASGKPQRSLKWRWADAHGALSVSASIASASGLSAEVVAEFSDATPAILARPYGKGGALSVLAAFGGKYLDARSHATLPEFKEQAAGWQALVALVLRQADVQPFARVRTDGGNVRGVQLYRMRLGDATLLGLVRDWEAVADTEPGTYPAALELREPATVMDLFSGKGLGVVDKIPVQMAPDAVSLFSLQTR